VTATLPEKFLWFLKAPLGPLPCPPRRNEHERLAAFAAYQTVLWMLADERVHGTENGDMLRVGRGRPRIGFVRDVQGREIVAAFNHRQDGSFEMA
jgi:hypothetical protein